LHQTLPSLTNLQRYSFNSIFNLLNIISYTCLAATNRYIGKCPRYPIFATNKCRCPQPTVAEAQIKYKASTDTKAQPKRQKSVLIPTPYLAPPSQPEPADAPERAVDPSAQGMSSAVASQGLITDEITEELLSVLAPINPAAEDIPSAGTADPSHGTL
jgi:hypothetical protein